MPRLKLLLPNRPSAWTKVPNLLLDRLLPALRDTELRIILVLLRQTNGWNRPGQTVILSYRRLTTATGRHSEAIARALASLDARGLIHMKRRSAVRIPKAIDSESEGQQYKERM